MSSETDKKPVDVTTTTSIPTESPAWHPAAWSNGLKFFQEHCDDHDQATPAELNSLAQWLFATPTRIIELQAALRNVMNSFGTPKDEPARPYNRLPLVDAAQGIAILLRWLQEQAVDIKRLSHAQFVQLWHVFVEQEDVKLLQPYLDGEGNSGMLGW